MGFSVSEHQPHEEPEVNPLASLNDWIVFPSSQELEVMLLLQSCTFIATILYSFCYFIHQFLILYFTG